MDARHRQVLIAIIRDYVDSAEPVGSRALAKRHMPSLSPATIRNVMADLEEMGYLSQPHASAGRVPTDKAYRFYVDSFPPPSTPAPPPPGTDRADRAAIDQLMEQTTASLSESSHFTGVLLAPPLRHTVLARVELLPLEDDRVLALVITDAGWVTARALTAPPNLTREDVREIGRELTARVRGRSVQEVLESAPPAGVLDPLRVRAGALMEQIIGILQDRTLYVSGATNMLDHPEFLDVGAMRQMLRTFEEKDRLIELLTGLVGWGHGVRVTIGGENPVEELQECTLVTSAYSYRGQVVGVLGIVGPRRMPYPQVMSIVSDTAERISERLARARRDLYLPS
jgi:heat-inducible transcriptional repressor